MKRFTAQFQLSAGTLDRKRIKGTLEQQLMRAPRLLVESIDIREDGKVTVEIKSEAERAATTQTLERLASALGGVLTDLYWGWADNAPMDAEHGLTVGETDLSGKPQEEIERKYTAGIARFTSLLAYVLVLVAGVWLVLNAPAPFGILFFLYCCVLVFYGAVFNGGVYSLGLIHYVTSIECSQQGLKARYWVRPPLVLAWNRIYGMRIRLGRGGYWCEVQAVGIPKLLPLVFPVSVFYFPVSPVSRLCARLYALKDAPTLIATIAERASLRLVEYYGGGDILFKHPEAP
jgi:hypothetical protein